MSSTQGGSASASSTWTVKWLTHKICPWCAIVVSVRCAACRTSAPPSLSRGTWVSTALDGRQRSPTAFAPGAVASVCDGYVSDEVAYSEPTEVMCMTNREHNHTESNSQAHTRFIVQLDRANCFAGPLPEAPCLSFCVTVAQ